ncbi:MAG TPA: efflux RND transporter periplasmic adaptor subunit [Verrucomicrobiae bacterium]|jgi:multidrug efflux pump subunit AcrA (membrane-fusion protein)
MKAKSILIGGVIVVCAALGIYALVKSRGGSSAGDNSDNVPTLVSVQTGKLQRMTLHDYITGYGTVGAAPATQNEPSAGGPLSATGAGIVSKVDVVQGQHVEKGDVLIELNSSSATFEYAQAEVARQKQLYAQQNTSLKSLEDAQAQLASLQVVAPVTGTVTRLSVVNGQAVDTGTPVAEVIDLDRLAVETKIPEAQAGALAAGEDVMISNAAPVTASLTVVSPAVDSNDGTVSAWAALPANSGLSAGQFVQLKIVTGTHTNCLAAPENSVVTDDSGQSTISLIKDDQAHQMPVQTGYHENGWVEIQGNGLAEGDTVATIGAYGLPDQTKVQIINPSDGTTNTAAAQ